MTIALSTVLDVAPSTASWATIALAALNVLQTIALAYLAAHARSNGKP